MANISTWLQKIATAIYGKDMREAIHDSIEAVNNDLENDKILTDGKLGAKADKSYNKGFVGGQNASLGGEGGAALGLEAKASKGAAAGAHAQASEGGSAGNGAYTSHGGSVGQNAYSLHGASIGRNTKTCLGVAAGDNAQTVNGEGEPIDAIQLGTGTNTNEKTFKVYEFQMMDNNGIIPVERLPEDTYMKVKKSLITEPDFPNEDYSTIIYRIEHSYEDPNDGLTETCSHYILSGIKDDEYVWEKILTGTISSENTSFCGYSTTPVQVGTWIDGTPIWRKAFEYTFTAEDLSLFKEEKSASVSGIASLGGNPNNTAILGGVCWLRMSGQPCMIDDTQSTHIYQAYFMFPDLDTGYLNNFVADSSGFYGYVDYMDNGTA